MLRYYTFVNILYRVNLANLVESWDNFRGTWLPSKLFKDELALFAAGAQEVTFSQAQQHIQTT